MNIQIPQQFEFLFQPRRYKIMYSGRMAGKSWSVAQALLIMGTQKKLRILAAREFQNSIVDSVHKLLSDMNDRYSFGYEVTKDSIKHPITKSEIVFYGLKTNITKIKSLEGIDICWIEEAETVSQHSLDIVIPTIRKEASELWMTFNPSAPTDAVYKKFVTPNIETLTQDGTYVDQQCYILRTHYSENPFLSDTALAEIEKSKLDDYERFRHVYDGYPVEETKLAIIKPQWFEAAIDAHLHLNFKAKGIKVIGFDPADNGLDAKAYCFRHGSVIFEIDQWLDGDLEDACDKVYEAAISNKATDIVYDVCGLGVAAKIKLNILDPSDRIVKTPFNSSNQPDYANEKYKNDQLNIDVFKNKRAQYYTELANRFENTYKAVIRGEYIDPDDLISLSSSCEHLPLLKQELTSIRRKAGLGKSFIQIESKIDMKRRGVMSPNLSDSLVYTLANPTAPLEEYTQIIYASQW